MPGRSTAIIPNKGGQAERALEHQLVERNGPDLGRQVSGVRDEFVVQLAERAVEQLAE
jgi:hypothetical protein